MSTRLVPEYVEEPAWRAYDAYMNYLDSDDLDDLRDALGDLRDGLLRGQALKHAPSYVVAEWLGVPDRAVVRIADAFTPPDPFSRKV